MDYLMNPADYVELAEPQNIDDDYEYIGGRLRRKRKLKKEYREQGLSRKEARKAARKTMKEGIKAIKATPKTESDNGEGGLEDDLLDGGLDANNPLNNIIQDDGLGELEGGSDWSSYLIYGGIGVGVLLIVGVLFLSGGSKATAQPTAAAV